MDRRGATFAAMRYGARVLLWSGALITASLLSPIEGNRILSALVKGLHSILEWPAPYLLIDIDHRPLLSSALSLHAALVLAAHWRPLAQRLCALLMGSVLLSGPLVVYASLHYSPYIPNIGLTAFWLRQFGLLGSVALPVLVWYSSIGSTAPWFAPPDVGGRQRGAGGLRTSRLAAGIVLLCAFSVTLGVISAVDEAATLRANLARSLIAQRHQAAFSTTLELLARRSDHRALTYLGAGLAAATHQTRVHQVMFYQACRQAGLLTVYFAKYKNVPDVFLVQAER